MKGFRVGRRVQGFGIEPLTLISPPTMAPALCVNKQIKVVRSTWMGVREFCGLVSGLGVRATGGLVSIVINTL